MINIRVKEYDKEKLAQTPFSVNNDNILVQNNNPLDFNSYVVRDLLREKEINYYPVAYCEDTNRFEENYYTLYVRENGRKKETYITDKSTNDYFYCEDCDAYYTDDFDTYEVHDGHYVCEDCRYDHYNECYDCGELYYCDDTYYCEDCDEYYCSNCWENHYHNDTLLYEYHEFNSWVLHKTEDEPEPPFYIGHELEIDEGDEKAEAVDTISQVEGICMHDGSLSDCGIEFISHPLSYNYMLSQEEKYRKCFEHLVNLGYKSHNTDTCGLHFHVTRPENPQIVDRIILFMETYKEEIFKISRRKSEELNRWSRFLSDKRTTTDPKVIKSLDYIVNNKDTCDRYMALNLSNRKTIEFRFFKGTLKYETFMADFEFINNLVMFASDLSLPVEELTWTKVTSVGHFLPQYIEEHNLQSDKPIIDYSKETIIEFNEEKSKVRIETDNLIAEILKNISNKARQKNNTSDKLKTTQQYISQVTSILDSLRIILFELENLTIFNYQKLDNLKSDLKWVKERLGK